MGKQNGQIALEFMTMFGIALTFVMAAYVISVAYSSDSVRVSQAQDVVDRLAAAADYVYALDPNSKEYVEIYMPEETDRIQVDGKRVNIRIKTTAGESDAYASTKAELINALPDASGRQRVLVQHLLSGKVLLGEAGLECSPNALTFAGKPGTTGASSFTITNRLDSSISGINATITDAISTAVTMPVPPPTTLPAMGSAAVTLQYTLPSTSGTYGGDIIAYSDRGTCATQAYLIVNSNTTCPSLCASSGYSGGTCQNAEQDCILNGMDHRSAYDFGGAQEGCGASLPTCCCEPTSDMLGPIVSFMNHTPENATIFDNVTAFATCNDTGRGDSYISYAEYKLDGGAWKPLVAGGSGFNSSIVQDTSAMIGNITLPGQHIIEARCRDTANNIGPSEEYPFNVTMGDLIGPIISFMNHTGNGSLSSNITITGRAADTYVGNNSIAGCKVAIDPVFPILPNDSIFQEAYALDGAFDTPEDDFGFNVSNLAVKWHTIVAYCTDSKNNTGGMYNYSFGVTAGDIMLMVDASGTMAANITVASNSQKNGTKNSSFTWMKSLQLPNTDLTNAVITVNFTRYNGSAGCFAFFETHSGGLGTPNISVGNTTSTSFAIYGKTANITATSPYTLDLYMKTNCSAAWANVSNFNVSQSFLDGAKDAAKNFVDMTDNNTQLGLVSFGTTATTVKLLTAMDSANRSDLKTAIDALPSPSGSKCKECGLDNAVDELTSERSRYIANSSAVGVGIMITSLNDSVNIGTTINGANYAASQNVTVHAIGLGSGIDELEARGIADRTGGQFYNTTDVATLNYIFTHIGQ